MQKLGAIRVTIYIVVDYILVYATTKLTFAAFPLLPVALKLAVITLHYWFITSKSDND
jgi:hypothetical protein